MQSCFLCFGNCVHKKHKKETRHSRRSYQQYTRLTMTTSNSIVSYQDSLPTELKLKVRGNKIVVGTVVKAKIGELEEEVRAGSSRRTRKELTGVVQGVLGRRRFENRCEKNLSSNQLTVVIVENILKEKEPEVSKTAEIPEEQVKLEKGYYLCVYVMLRLKKEVVVDRKEEQAKVEGDPDEEEMDDANLDNKMEYNWKMVSEDNDGGVGDAKALLHAKR